MKTGKPQQLSVLLEHENGVMEVFFAVLESGGQVSFKPVGSVPRSGSIRATDRETLAEAVQLLQWSKCHADVFEGRVVSEWE